MQPLILKLMIKPTTSKSFLLRRYYYPLTNHGRKGNDKFTIDNNKLSSIDLRSDTVSKPSADMKYAMKNWQGDDKNIILEFEQKMATLTGKESALFLLTGTMGNLISIICHCRERGSEIIVGNRAHIFTCEQANFSQFGGIQPFTVPTEANGTFSLDLVKSSIKDSSDFHYPSTKLICIENTHGSLGGRIVPYSWLLELHKISVDHGIPLHLDGARIFNASVACEKPLKQMLAPFDSVSICFSKALGCPMGSVIAGSTHFINNARRLRESLGAIGNRPGFLVAACLYALDHNVTRLSEDHQNARLLARGINETGSSIAWVIESQVETNIVLLHLDPNVMSPQQFCDRLLLVSEEEKNELDEEITVLAFPHTISLVRFVVHLNVPKSMILSAIAKINFILREGTCQEKIL